MALIKTPSEIEKITVASKFVATTLNKLKARIKPGIRTKDLEVYAQQLLREANLKSSFKGYAPTGIPYPAVLCTSVNEEVGHVPPGDRRLNSGDILSMDFGAIYEGYHGDSAVTVPVGSISFDAHRLINTCLRALYIGIEQARPGNSLGTLGGAIQDFVEDKGYTVCRDVSGHGIGTELHEEPMVFHYRGSLTADVILEPGMTICIEPMVCLGESELCYEGDGWSLLTQDGSISAHFEHTLLITNEDPEILSKVAGSH